jgi:hypothetical protein
MALRDPVKRKKQAQFNCSPDLTPKELTADNTKRDSESGGRERRAIDRRSISVGISDYRALYEPA